jgi:hypothetical protein
MVLWYGGQRIGEKQPIEQSDRELLGKVTLRSYRGMVWGHGDPDPRTTTQRKKLLRQVTAGSSGGVTVRWCEV